MHQRLFKVNILIRQYSSGISLTWELPHLRCLHSIEAARPSSFTTPNFGGILRTIISASMPRAYKRGSAVDHQRIIDKYNAGEDFLTMAAELGVKRTTAYAIVKQHQRRVEQGEEFTEFTSTGQILRPRGYTIQHTKNNSPIGLLWTLI